MSDILDRICADKRVHVAERKSLRSLSKISAAAEGASAPRGFAQRLAEGAVNGYGLIAEIKKASPSKGLIRDDFRPAALAHAYERGGAVCISVLTDVAYFQGADEDLIAARAAVSLPVLRKDFMLDPYQIVESRALGADCVLLILAALSDAQAAELESAAVEMGMDVLAEVHDAVELERALKLRTPLIGINNRDLKTLDVDTKTTEALAPKVPAGKTLISESGLGGGEGLDRMARAGVRCFLVGESLLRHGDVKTATRRFLAGAKAPPVHAKMGA